MGEMLVKFKVYGPNGRFAELEALVDTGIHEYKNCLRLIRNGKKIGNSHRFSQCTQLIVMMSGLDKLNSL